MVQLQFEVQVQAQFQQVWCYFSNFQNISDWDPNSISCKVVEKTHDEIGSVYDIVSRFDGKESSVLYKTISYQVTKDYGHIRLFGKNSKITAWDEIICQRKGPKLTTITYKADICLRHILVLFTPFIRSGLDELTVQAKEGCIKKAIQKWGMAK